MTKQKQPADKKNIFDQSAFTLQKRRFFGQIFFVQKNIL